MELEYELAFAATCYWAGRVGKESGLMICMEHGRDRSPTQVPGIRSRGRRERSAASSGMRACSGQHGTPLLREMPF